MKSFYKKGLVVLGLVVLLSFFLISFGDFGKIQGKVVWEEDSFSATCSDFEVSELWEEIFIEGSDGISIYNKSEENCDGFIAVKTDGSSQVWMLFLEVGDEISIVGTYFDAVGEKFSDVEAVSTYSEAKAIGVGTDDCNPWSENIETEEEADEKFEDYYFADSNLFVDAGSYYGSRKEEGSSVISSAAIWPNETFIKYMWLNGQEVSGYDIVQMTDIPDEAIIVNSSWTDLLDLDDKFNSDVLPTYECIPLDSSNEDFSEIDCEVEPYGVLKVEPAAGFKGSRDFKVRVRNIAYGIRLDSNEFNVSVVESINHPPVLTTSFGELFLPAGSSWNFDMRLYFEDEDENDSLSYSLEGIENLGTSWKGSILTVSVPINMTDGFESFYVVASDGEDTEKSNEVVVFVSNDTTVVNESLANESVSSEGLQLVNSSVTNSSSNASNGDEGDESSFFGVLIFWFWIVVGILAIFGGILWLIHFEFLRKKGNVKLVDEGKTAVQDYLNSLNDQKNGVQTGNQTAVEGQVEKTEPVQTDSDGKA